MKVLILDDHSMFSEGLGRILTDHFSDLKLDKFKSISELTRKKRNFKNYNLFITDIELPGEDTFEFLANTKSKYPNLPMLVISMHNKLTVIKKCKHLGIEGYILKDDHELIISVVNMLLTGGEFYSERVKKTLAIRNRNERLLTPKEEEILSLTANGMNNVEIAEKTFISYNTVKTHLKNIKRKLKMSTVGELIRYYFKNYVK